MDTDTLTFKIFSMHEIAERIINGVRIEGVGIYQTIFSIQSCWQQLEKFTAVSVEPDFNLFLLKNLMLDEPCYLVRLLSVNDKAMNFKLEDYKYEEQKELLNQLLNGVFTVGFYNKDTLEEVGRFHLNYLDAVQFYFLAGELDTITRKKILTYFNHTVSYYGKENVIFLCRQSYSNKDILKKYEAYLDNVELKDISFCSSALFLLRQFSCDTKPLVKLPCKFLAEM